MINGGETCFFIEILAFLFILVFDIKLKYDKNFLGFFNIHIHLPYTLIYENIYTYIYRHIHVHKHIYFYKHVLNTFTRYHL
jgi:hypothetical protein